LPIQIVLIFCLKMILSIHRRYDDAKKDKNECLEFHSSQLLFLFLIFFCIAYNALIGARKVYDILFNICEWEISKLPEMPT